MRKKVRSKTFVGFLIICWLFSALAGYVLINTRANHAANLWLNGGRHQGHKTGPVLEYIRSWLSVDTGVSGLEMQGENGKTFSWQLPDRIEKFDHDLNRLHVLALPDKFMPRVAAGKIFFKYRDREMSADISENENHRVFSFDGNTVVLSRQEDTLSALVWAQRTLELDRFLNVWYDPDLFYKVLVSEPSYLEGPFTQFDNKEIQWGFGLETGIRIFAFKAGIIQLEFTYATCLQDQEMTVLINNENVSTLYPETTLKSSVVFSTVQKGENKITFRYKKSLTNGFDQRPLAVLFSSIVFKKPDDFQSSPVQSLRSALPVIAPGSLSEAF